MNVIPGVPGHEVKSQRYPVLPGVLVLWMPAFAGMTIRNSVIL